VPVPKKDGEDQAIGISKGGLSTKIHATVDALGNPTSFHLTPGQALDLCGADKLILTLEANILLADKAYDASERVIDVLQNAGKKSVIPSKSSHLEPREYDRELYKARHLIENFFCKLNQFRAISTRYDTTACNILAAI
jgi:transposase